MANTAKQFKTLNDIFNKLFPENMLDELDSPLKSIGNVNLPLSAIKKWAIDSENKNNIQSVKRCKIKRKAKFEAIKGVPKPTSPFFLYFDHVKLLVEKEGIKYNGNLRKYAGEQWGKLSEDDRKFWSRKFESIKADYFFKKKQLEDKENAIWMEISNDQLNSEMAKLPELNLEVAEEAAEEIKCKGGDTFDMNTKESINTLLTEIPI